MPTGSRMMRQTARERTCVWMLMSIWGVYHVNMCKRARWHRGRRGMWKYVQMCQLMQPLQRPGRRWLRAVPGRSGWDRGLEAGDLVSRHVSLDTVHALSDTRHTRHPTRQTQRRDQVWGCAWVVGWLGGWGDGGLHSPKTERSSGDPRPWYPDSFMQRSEPSSAMPGLTCRYKHMNTN